MENTINVLDKGRIKLVESMGNDDSIATSAWISTNKHLTKAINSYKKVKEIIKKTSSIPPPVSSDMDLG